jgi:hypothetical protein
MVAAMLGAAWAQEIKMPPAFDKLAAKAQETVDVTLDSNMLQLAGKFLSDKDADQAKARKIIAGLKGITVRSFEFAKEGEYSMTDADALREQLKAPGWSRIVNVTSKDENTEIYLRQAEGSQIGGMVVINAEPKELTIVSLSGTISVDDLSALAGQFGIPEAVEKAVPSKNKGKEEE